MSQKYKVVWKVFFSKDQIHEQNLTFDEATKLSADLNNNDSDVYEYTVVEPQ